MSDRTLFWIFLFLSLLALVFLVYQIIKARGEKFKSENYPAVFGIRMIIIAYISLAGLIPSLLNLLYRAFEINPPISDKLSYISFAIVVIGILGILWARYLSGSSKIFSISFFDFFLLRNQGTIGKITKMRDVHGDFYMDELNSGEIEESEDSIR